METEAQGEISRGEPECFLLFCFWLRRSPKRSTRIEPPLRAHRGLDHFGTSPLNIFSLSAIISAPLHADVLALILTGRGKRPLLQPAHQALRLTGMTARTSGKRNNESSVMCDAMSVLLVVLFS